MASWDFTIDSDKQNELAGKLSEAADNFDTKISLLYGQIDSMNGTSWVGEDYDTFREGVHNYEGALKDLSNGFRMFGEHYKLMAEGTTTLASDLITIVKNMTGTIDGSSSSGGGSASYDSGAGMSDDVGNEGDASHSPSMSYGADAEEGGNGAHQSESGATHGGGGHRADDAGDGESESGTHQSDVVGDTTSSPQDENSENNASGNSTSNPVTVSSGQEVTLENGEKCYFVMRNSSGIDFYTRDNDVASQIMVIDENGKLIPYESDYYGGIVTRDKFVDKNKYNLENYWKVTYNNGISPYENVSINIDSSFTSSVSNPNQELIQFSDEYLNSNATTLDEFDRGSYSLGRTDTMPTVIKLAPGQKITFDKPWDTYDNVISGGENGKYMVYDSSKDAYFVINDGAYKTENDGTFGLWISSEQLLSDRTSITK